MKVREDLMMIDFLREYLGLTGTSSVAASRNV
jgi:aerobic-type carbon monoxide dehydrogenase small subunit (CoxS/CutS family)